MSPLVMNWHQYTNYLSLLFSSSSSDSSMSILTAIVKGTPINAKFSCYLDRYNRFYLFIHSFIHALKSFDDLHLTKITCFNK